METCNSIIVEIFYRKAGKFYSSGKNDNYLSTVVGCFSFDPGVELLNNHLYIPTFTSN